MRVGVARESAPGERRVALVPETVHEYPMTAVSDGLFVVRERRAEGGESAVSDEGAEEMARLLKEWGYAHGSK